MIQYINDNLSANPNVRILMENDKPKANTLVLNIVRQAEGVFLWVRLVVRKLLDHYPNDEI
jgi:hemerythrin superfamily protein